MPNEPADSQFPPRLDELIAAYFQAIERGERPDSEKVIADNPEEASGLRAFFVDLHAAKEFFPPTAAFQPDLAATTPPDPQRPAPLEGIGSTIAGKYKLLQEIGEGGMGTVYMAQQTGGLKRLVAVKLIRRDLKSANVLARFEAERQALALMDHPNIAKVFDGGTADSGRPFYVMELVKGRPLLKYCDDKRLSIADRLALFAQICLGVQHAHQKGIIHRDLKPSNILVEEHDGKPVPKIIDFGLAKSTSMQLTDKTLYTDFGMVLGTYLYMAPEQAVFNALDIDTRADVYALGVILYELLTGSTPLERAQLQAVALDEVLRTIREVDAPKPSDRLSKSGSLPSVAATRNIEPAQLSRMMRGDLDWIVMKSLEKERKRRYQTPAELLEDLTRYRELKPITAGAPNVFYRFQKFIRRNRLGVILFSVITLAILFSVLAGVYSVLSSANARAVAAELRTKSVQAQADKVKAEEEARSTAIINAGLRYQQTMGRIRERRSVRAAGWTWENLAELKTAAAIQTALKNANEIRTEAATAITAVDARPAGELEQKFLHIRSLAFHPQNSWLAVGDGLAGYRVSPMNLHVVDVATRQTIHKLQLVPRFALDDLGRKDGFDAIEFSPDGRWLVSGSGVGNMYVWDLHESPPRFHSWTTNLTRIHDLVFSPDSKSVVARNYDKKTGRTTRLASWQVESWSEQGNLVVEKFLQTLIPLGNESLLLVCDEGTTAHNFVTLAELSPAVNTKLPENLRSLDPSGSLFARVAGPNLELLQRKTGAVVRALRDDNADLLPNNVATFVRFTPDASVLLASNETFGTLIGWDLAGDEKSFELPVPSISSAHLYIPEVSADGKWVAVAADDRTLLYEIAQNRGHRYLAPHTHAVTNMQLSSDGQQLVCGGPEGAVTRITIWRDLTSQSLQPNRTIEATNAVGIANNFSFTGAGEYVAFTIDPQRPARFIGRHRTGAEVSSSGLDFEQNINNHSMDTAGNLWITSGPRLFLSRRNDEQAKLFWEDKLGVSLKTNRRFPVICVGTTKILLGDDNSGFLVLIDRQNPHSGFVQQQLPRNEMASSASLLPGEQHAVVGLTSGRLGLASLKTAELDFISAGGHQAKVSSVASLGTGYVVSGGFDQTVRIWRVNARRLEEVFAIQLDGPVLQVAATLDGKTLLALVRGETRIHSWDLTQLQTMFADLDVPLPVPFALKESNP